MFYDDSKQQWIIRNQYFDYRIGLKNNQCHHIGFLPVGLWTDDLVDQIMELDLQPEAEVHIYRENRAQHHGLRWIGCSASQRAEYQSFQIVAGENEQELVITTLDVRSQLQINYHYRIYEHSPALTRFVSLVNLSEVPISIEHLGSFSLHGMPFFNKAEFGEQIMIHSFPSSWYWEGQKKSVSAEEAGLFSAFNLASRIYHSFGRAL
ncbi:hypothetical protein EHS13_35275 [Paenibacillus psychroresistens]|uniref:Glycosyl hydrolase family 36 N-terminal domain-containing protein n=1 Tax=Paenibacillus psychroresistens TaxID=1778678 RepID=A0A6B8RVF9_9BACL|nr:glycoside hydrolase family 36 N-terminal domain-containing protein [Paenibacillus psychroresistens]QGQ99754.1 hypothetical protein EHS13_35275 [Paenibacillus psychroresistens]